MHINKHDGDDKDNDEVEANDTNAATWIRIGTSSFRSSFFFALATLLLCSLACIVGVT